MFTIIAVNAADMSRANVFTIAVILVCFFSGCRHVVVPTDVNLDSHCISGEWGIRFFPSSASPTDYRVMDLNYEESLLDENPIGIEVLRAPIKIDFLNDQIIIQGQNGSPFYGKLKRNEYGYATGVFSAMNDGFGVSVITIYFNDADLIYGIWSRIFVGISARDYGDPPGLDSFHFRMERGDKDAESRMEWH